MIPEGNVGDLREIPEKIKSKLEIRPVKWIDEVFDLVLTEKPKVWEEKGENSSKSSRGRKTRKISLKPIKKVFQALNLA